MDKHRTPGLMGGMLILMSLTFAAHGLQGEYRAATSHGKVNTSVMGCPAGSFWDAHDGGGCWTCGSNERGAHPIHTAEACLVTPKPQPSPATRIERNKVQCTGDSFHILGTTRCWTCPGKSKPADLSLGSKKACEIVTPKREEQATYVYTVGSLLKSCRKGTFANVGSRRCYECRDGWEHDPSKKVGTKGVCYKPRKVAHLAADPGKMRSRKCDTGFFDRIQGGSCWTCPAGYERQVTPVTDDNACLKISAPGFAPAKFVKKLKPSTQAVIRGLSDLGCGEYGQQAFFDPIKSGTCWSCPKSHPRRSLYAVTGTQACMTNQCGLQGGRPCLVWERVPSCNAGPGRGLHQKPVRSAKASSLLRLRESRERFEGFGRRSAAHRPSADLRRH